MVRASEEEQESYRSRLFNFKWRNNENNNATRHAKSLSVETGLDEAATGSNEAEPLTIIHPGKAPPLLRSAADEAALTAALAREKQLLADVEQMKERFSKLLLGEDNSGGGKGVSSALALSNAITNIAASVFGEQRRLEPMPAERRARWRKEIDWLLSVTDYVVEFAPSQQKNKDGTNMEIMTTRQRTDLHMNIPALKKLDAMLIDCLENFKDQSEFSYVSKDSSDADKRNDEKWWIPTVKVPPDGLSDAARRFLQYQKDCVNQVLKAAMAINAQVLFEMEIPESYIDSLPKNGRASLGDQMYKHITVDFFDPDQFLNSMDMSSEHKIVDLKNRIEASIVIWKRKMVYKDSKSSAPWASGVSLEKREVFEERAETILLILKHRYPGISQSSLDISKIQFNKDVGQAVLESYSRILESLAYTVLSRIDDVLEADRAVNKRSPPIESEEETLVGSMTLSDFMGWDFDQAGQGNGDLESKKDVSDDQLVKEKLPAVTTKKTSYLETLGGVKSPTARH
ncbi:PREDICTED: rop guanine nucleotide exchange factor 12-like [Camelina sativa]|uniref:Rop guanine nucleotide exchange factor 12-like n=1 Tax=Camelina sativa TaxID=90675 RepID=A0ABM0TR92_CAMSA|nr:PREDICTED: rop guanine nucleotide exchange factor 12-like [Camelina sativa]